LVRFGCVSFGGPAGQIAQLHRDLVHERRWISEAEFQQALNVCMLLPGPEALQLVIYLGTRWLGTFGGVWAGLCFLIPGTLLMLLLAWVYVTYGEIAPIAAALRGLQAVVIALVAQAVWRLASRRLVSASRQLIACAALLALTALHLAFPWIILLAAAVGFLCYRDARVTPRAADLAPAPRFPWVPILAGLAAWCLPLLVLRVIGGREFSDRLYMFFTKVAILGFGGAYALLTWVNDALVAQLAWLTPPDLVAGVALAETTPGPLTLVLPFYGFVAGFRHASVDGAVMMGIVHALLAGWATFLPSFVMVIAGARYFERWSRLPSLAAALEGVTAAVVGVMASFGLSIGFLLLWMPQQHRPDVMLCGLTVLSLWALTRTRINLLWVLATAAMVSGVATFLR